jgi:hypothetical protein
MRHRADGGVSTIASSRPSEVAEIIANVQLNDVRLIDASVRTRIRDVARLGDAHLAMRHKTKVIMRSEKAFLVAAVMRAEVVGDAAGDSENPLVVMNVTFALEYKLESAARFSDEDLAEFARVNGAFNAWPYWREYVQTTSARMSLPPITLPVFRVRPRERSEPTVDTKAQKPVGTGDTVVSMAKSSGAAHKKR